MASDWKDSVRDQVNRVRKKNQYDPGIDLKEISANKHYHGEEADPEVLRTNNYEARVIFVKYGCEFCEKWVDVISRFNAKLDRRAQPIEITTIQHPSTHRENLQPQGAPVLYIDGIMVKGVTTKGFAEGFLEGFLEDEMVMD